MVGQSLETAEQLLRAAGERTRLRLLHLCSRGEHTVSDLMQVLEQSQPRVSRHLKILCDAGLLERFRDGHWVYYRVPLTGPAAAVTSQVLTLLDADDEQLTRDRQAFDQLLGQQQGDAADPAVRRFNRLVLDNFLAHPVGDLLDIGVGTGAILKLLAGRASKAVGIDIDSASRHAARRSFASASLANCTVRRGDMYRLRFPDGSFDTVVLDEVLLAADRPLAVMREASRMLRAGGRLLLVEKTAFADAQAVSQSLSALVGEAGLQCAPIRQAAGGSDVFLVTMAVVPGHIEQVSA